MGWCCLFTANTVLLLHFSSKSYSITYLTSYHWTFHVIAYFLSLNREGIRVLTVRLYRLESMSLTLDCTNRQTGDKVFLEEGIRTGDGYNNDDRDSHTNSLRRH